MQHGPKGKCDHDMGWYAWPEEKTGPCWKMVRIQDRNNMRYIQSLKKFFFGKGKHRGSLTQFNLITLDMLNYIVVLYFSKPSYFPT